MPALLFIKRKGLEFGVYMRIVKKLHDLLNDKAKCN